MYIKRTNILFIYKNEICLQIQNIIFYQYNNSHKKRLFHL